MTKSASNNQVKEWRKLLMGKYRKKNGLFPAEGLRCVEQILKNSALSITEILTDGDFSLTGLSIPGSIPIFQLSSEDFSSISDTETSQGVIAVCKIPAESSIEEITKTEGLIIALDAIQDPGNLGTIIRTAAWFGVKGIIFGTGCVDPFHPKVVRSTAGATGAIPYLKGDLKNILNHLERETREIFLLDGSARSESLGAVSTSKNAVIVVGNEGSGIDSELIKPSRKLIRIDGHSDVVESLNAAIAMSIALNTFSR